MSHATATTTTFLKGCGIHLYALAFLCGILAVQQMPALPSFWWAVLLVPLLALAYWRRAALPAVFLVAGALWVTLQSTLILANSLAPQLEGKDLWLEGYIADLPQTSERGLRFEFDVKRARLDGQPVAVPDKILLSLSGLERRVRVGDEWGFWVRLKRPHGFQNPGGFDYEGYLFRERIRATGYVRSSAASKLLSARLSAYPLGRFRQYIGTRIHQALPDSAHAGVITAFANGDQTDIDDAQWEVLRRTGTTHLIAISGMNIGLIAGIVFFLARWLWTRPGVTVLRIPAQKVAALAALAAALFYAALAGFAIPTQRALIMLAVVMGAVLAQRSVRPLHLLAVALLLVLMYDPLAVMSAGFWLSFAAVAVILLAVHGRAGESKWSQWSRLQWVMAIGLLPLMLAMFQQTSLSAPLANMLAIPVIEMLVIPLTLLGVFLLFLPQFVAHSLFQLAAWAMDKLWLALDYLAGLGHALWTQPAPLTWTLPCAAVGVLILLAPRGWPGRWVGAVWLLPMLLVRPAGPAPGELWFTLLDVGQGLAAVAQTQKHTLVFDTGARFSARFDMGRAVIVPFLRASGVETLDALIVSHGDNDHIGGAPSLLKDFPARHLLSSAPRQLPNAAPCEAGQYWQWDDVEFLILNPTGPTAKENNGSCVLLISSRHGTVLLSADIEAAAERLMVKNWGDQLRAHVLVVPHHGSKTSSTEEFLSTVRPEYALFPFGYRNRYRHPHPSVVQRYAKHNIPTLNSAQHGAVEIKFSAHGMDMAAYRQTHQRYWFTQQQ